MKLLLTLATAIVLLLFGLPGQQAAANPPQRVVYYVDHTDSRFPVINKVADWDKAPRVKFVKTNTCHGTQYCVDFYQDNLRRGWAGLTRIYRYRNGDIRYHIFLDTDPRTPYKRRSVICHEIGHTLGIGHNGRGCMTNSPRRYPQYPGWYNLQKAR